MDQQDQRTPEQRKLDQLQAKYAKNYLTIPMLIMLNPELTLADKVVYGRAFGFEFLFESPTQTAAVLGISTSQVRISKRKLERLGLLICTDQNFFGKTYKTRLPDFNKPLSESDNPLSENDNPLVKICQPPCQNLTTEYKERLNGEKSLNSSFDKSKEDEQARNLSVDVDPLNEEQPKRYGNEDVNAMLDLWESETGFSHHRTKAERYAMSGLIRQYGCEALKALIRRVGRARRSDNRFAPQIAKPSQLRGKYSKLEALTIWEERMEKEPANESTGPDLQKLYATPSEYLRDDPEPTATKEELHEAAEAIRESYRGTKYEHIFCRRKMGGQK